VLHVYHSDGHILYIGTSAGEWIDILGRGRLEHVFVVGATGSGKTTTMMPGFIQDAQQGRGGVFFDICGRYSRLLLDYVLRGREVVYLNAADFEYSFAWKELHNVPSEYRHVVMDSIVSALRQQWRDGWGDRMEYIITNSLLTLLPYGTATLLDLNRVISDEKWCLHLVQTKMTNTKVRGFWLNEFPRGNRSVDVRHRHEWLIPVQNKIERLAVVDPLANILGQVKNKINLRHIMDKQKLLIVNLDKGKIGERNANLLGSLL